MLLKMQKEGLEKTNVKLSHPRHAKKYNSIKQKRKKANKKQIQKKSKIKQQKTPKRAITYNMLFCFVFALEKNAAVKKQLVLCTFSFIFLLFVFALFFALFERLISCGAFLLALFFNTFFERWTRTGFHKIHQDLSTRNILWRVYYFIIWFTKVVFVPKEDGGGGFPWILSISNFTRPLESHDAESEKAAVPWWNKNLSLHLWKSMSWEKKMVCLGYM